MSAIQVRLIASGARPFAHPQFRRFPAPSRHAEPPTGRTRRAESDPFAARLGGGRVARRLLPIVVFLLAALLASCSHPGRSAPTTMSLGVPPLEQNALLYVAAARGIFAKQDLKLAIRDYDSGPAAIAALASGAVDVVETAEFPFVESVMKGTRLRILAANDEFENDYLVARRDRGIAHAADLAGKRIGVTLGTVTQFYLGRFLTVHGVPAGKVTEVNVGPASFASSILEGRVDALVAWQPYVSRIENAHPGAFEVWPVQSSQPVYGILVCTGGWLASHASDVNSLLRSLAAAESFLVDHPRSARSIVAKRLGYSGSYMLSVWPDHEFSLTLDYSLVAAMDDEARWLIDHRLTRADSVPNFEQLIYLAGLESARPVGVNMME